MTMTKSLITIKGNRDGLVFWLDDSCSLDELYSHLRQKMEQSEQPFFSGPPVEITIQLGNRYMTPEQERELLDIFAIKPNFTIRSIESSVISKEQALLDKLASIIRLETRTIRSGQELRHDGDLLLVGDINPGGAVYCAGSIFVMGALRGLAHAGCDGDEQAIIAASLLRPTQLRIANAISRPPDERPDSTCEMEFAYLEEGRIKIDKINQLRKIRSEYLNGRAGSRIHGRGIVEWEKRS